MDLGLLFGFWIFFPKFPYNFLSSYQNGGIKPNSLLAVPPDKTNPCQDRRYCAGFSAVDKKALPNIRDPSSAFLSWILLI